VVAALDPPRRHPALLLLASLLQAAWLTALAALAWWS
jgi:hypothetical protein